jgi:hypothetical protein
LTDLPAYQVTRQGAVFDEPALATVFDADGWFLVVGLAGGLILGLLLWLAFDRLGWRLVVALFVAACFASALAYAVGRSLGPGTLDPRLAAAEPGDRVAVALTVRSTGVFLSWPIGAMGGVFAAALSRRRARAIDHGL